MSPRGIAKKALIDFCSETTVFSPIHHIQKTEENTFTPP